MQTELNAAIEEVKAKMIQVGINPQRIDWLKIIKAAKCLIEQRKAQST